MFLFVGPLWGMIPTRVWLVPISTWTVATGFDRNPYHHMIWNGCHMICSDSAHWGNVFFTQFQFKSVYFTHWKCLNFFLIHSFHLFPGLPELLLASDIIVRLRGLDPTSHMQITCKVNIRKKSIFTKIISSRKKCLTSSTAYMIEMANSPKTTSERPHKCSVP